MENNDGEDHVHVSETDDNGMAMSILILKLAKGSDIIGTSRVGRPGWVGRVTQSDILLLSGYVQKAYFYMYLCTTVHECLTGLIVLNGYPMVQTWA